MRVYVDSSALAKRALDEAESDLVELALEGFAHAGFPVYSSTLAWVEVSRTVRNRLDAEPSADVAELVDDALSGVLECPITDQVIGIARRLGPTTLRSLDAIHLASATLLDADVVVAYDKRLLQAASEFGFRTLSP
ncbi:type II toxin-antitoxin system VapC family toxin [Lacisediminihabitans sp.]|uniref:type II toxin-antitoxin system VapC family toxin n=1 Tax=Lacisediminihabitans sp. TaxID=2787631 RepID=UPI00374CE3F7